MFTNLKALSILEGDVVKVESDGVVLWEIPSSFKNWVRYSTESDGTTIYNGGLGYKEYYRIRSGGAESYLDDAVITGFIPFKLGDVLRIFPPFIEQNTSNTINFYDASFTNLGQITDSGARYGICTTDYDSVVVDGVSTLTYLDSLDSRIAYVRIGNKLSEMGGYGANLIVTINCDIVATAKLPITWKNRYTCAYTIGSACTVSENTGYYITEEIPVKYGKTYSINLPTKANAVFRAVGVNNSDIVTEVVESRQETTMFAWIPTVETTTGLRLRGYSNAFYQVSGATEILVY